MKAILFLSDHFINNSDIFFALVRLFVKVILSFGSLIIFFEHHLRFKQDYNPPFSLTLLAFNSSIKPLKVQGPCILLYIYKGDI